ncbi:MAG: tetratricopeptide repeat protein [Candidatus Rokuibacteriota bacterium]
MWAQGIALTGKGDYEGALAAYQEGLALAEKVGDANTIPRYLNSLGWLLSECGDHDRALELTGIAAEGARKWRHAVGVEIAAYCEINRGDMWLDKGDPILAQAFLDEASRVVGDPATHTWMKWRYAMHLSVSLGELWLARGNLARARECAERCLDAATRTMSRKYLVRGWRLRGEIARAGRQWDESETALREALTIARAIGNPTQLWRTHLACGHLHAERKNPAEAGRAYRAAGKVADRIRSSLSNPRLRSSFEGSPRIREVYDLSARYRGE